MVLNAKSSNINIIWECAGNENFQAPTKSTESETLWGLFLFWGGGGWFVPIFYLMEKFTC